MKWSLFFLVIAVSGGARAQDNCDLKAFQSSRLDISMKDTAFLKQMMSYSYDGEAMKYIPQMKSSFSGVYYKGKNKNEPVVTYFFASYKNPQTAMQAAQYLKTRWIKNRNPKQYDVLENATDVMWFGNNSLSLSCFKKVVAAEKAKNFKR